VVCNVASHCLEYPAKFEALVMAGFKGWVKALDKYEVESTYKLSAYATWWIKDKIQNF